MAKTGDDTQLGTAEGAVTSPVIVPANTLTKSSPSTSTGAVAPGPTWKESPVVRSWSRVIVRVAEG